ncbi:MAG TPA: aminotransferase class V-fold PLP-dependent enzyme [Longimicrobiales bacterium]|nr:aminotransferase class V-fold PLP-dependent enzyme [Longimicrobiales bacterium]
MPAESAPLDSRTLRAQEFAALGTRVFLNAAGYGPLPARALAAAEHYQRRRAAAELTEDDFVAALVPARAAAARIVGAHAEEIALCPNTSVGINIAASIVRQRRRQGDPRHVIVVSQGEFPANVYPWLALERDGFRVRLIPTDPLGRPDEPALFRALMEPDVAVLALSAVQFSTGWRADLEGLGERCHARDILFVVDAIQAAGVVPLDVRAMHVDVLAAGGEKWLLSPYGTGFAFVRAGLCRIHEPELPGWLAFGATADVNRLCTYEYDLLEDARRFEVGTIAYQDVSAFTAALELLLELGVSRILEHVRALQQPLLEWLRARPGVVLVSDHDTHASGIMCLRGPDLPAWFEALTAADVICALREGSLRLAPHAYNTPEDMNHVIATLERSV